MKRRRVNRDRFLWIFTLSRSQRRGVLWLLPMVAIVAVVVAVANRTTFEKYMFEPKREVYAGQGDGGSGEAQGAEYGGAEQSYGGQQEEESPNPQGRELFNFDPNTVTLQELCRLGFSVKTAAGIIKYRERGKRFEIPEDFATCYGVTLEHYTRLEPHIKIDARFKAQKTKYGRSVEEAGSVEARDTVVYKRNEYYEKKEWVAVDINRADSATLRTVSGIGEVMVGRIMEYRQRLGGFAAKEQLAEVTGMMEANYERICEQIVVDSYVIQKIDINFASHKSLVERLGSHPYMTDKVLRKILKQRQLKGGWSTKTDMVNENILTQQEADKIAPYLVFNAL